MCKIGERAYKKLKIPYNFLQVACVGGYKKIIGPPHRTGWGYKNYRLNLADDGDDDDDDDDDDDSDNDDDDDDDDDVKP